MNISNHLAAIAFSDCIPSHEPYARSRCVHRILDLDDTCSRDCGDACGNACACTIKYTLLMRSWGWWGLWGHVYTHALDALIHVVFMCAM